MRIRATLKLRNDKMITAREKLGLTQIALAGVAGVPISTVQAFEQLNFMVGANTLKHVARVVGMLELTVEDILPEDMRDKVVMSKAVTVQEIATDALLTFNRAAQLPAPSDEHIDASEELQKALGQLTFREREIIKARRLPGEKDEIPSLRAIGKKFNVTKERVRQLEKSALRKLANPKHGLGEFSCIGTRHVHNLTSRSR